MSTIFDFTNLSNSLNQASMENTGEFKDLTIGQCVSKLPEFFRQIFTSSIMEFKGEQDYWKQRFSNDVLMSIDKGHRLVGWYCDYHGDEVCECDEEHISPCPNCYSYGTDLCSHVKWGHVSYEAMRAGKNHTSLIACPYIPQATFLYVFNYSNGHDYAMEFKAIRLALRKLNKEWRDDGIEVW